MDSERLQGISAAQLLNYLQSECDTASSRLEDADLVSHAALCSYIGSIKTIQQDITNIAQAVDAKLEQCGCKPTGCSIG